MRSPTSRARLAVSAAVTAGLCLTGTAGLATPSQAATGMCDTAYPVDQLSSDQTVTGLTVTQGKSPSTFSGTIIGVLKDGIEPDVDMVMAKPTPGATLAISGIIGAMSCRGHLAP